MIEDNDEYYEADDEFPYRVTLYYKDDKYYLDWFEEESPAWDWDAPPAKELTECDVTDFLTEEQKTLVKLYTTIDDGLKINAELDISEGTVFDIDWSEYNLSF